MGRIVMHVDLDAFFASVEERENPSLRGRPLVIGSDPKEGKGRGIVATANYEARKYGIHSAMPISIAFRLCPKAVFLRPRFRLYSEASRRVMNLLRPRADIFEQAGLDEAYLDVGSRGSFEAAKVLALEIKSEIKKEGLSASVGIGPNKLIAKIASDYQKPDGLTVIAPEKVREFLSPQSVRVLRGVGPKTEEHLHRLGYFKVEDLSRAGEEELRREFGKFGSHLLRESRGEDESPVDPTWEAKSIGREHTFEEDTGDWSQVGRTLEECVKDVHEQMIHEGFWCRTLTLKIRFEGYETHSRQKTLKSSTGRFEHLSEVAQELLEDFQGKRKKVRLIGFSVGKFSPPEDLLPLF